MKPWLAMILVLLMSGGLAAEDKTAPKSADDKPTSDKPATKKPFNPLDEDLKQSLGGPSEGEDVGTPEDPLVAIGQQMRTSEQRLGAGRVDDSTQRLQQQIVADIDQLIQKVQQNMQNSSSKSPNRRSAQQQPQREPQPGQQAGGGNQPARDSTDKIREDDLRKAQMGELKKSLEKLWGDLPDRARDEALQALGDSFLPKYDQQIRKYFQRLSEEEGKE